jgi:hypothetical protein
MQLALEDEWYAGERKLPQKLNSPRGGDGRAGRVTPPIRSETCRAPPPLAYLRREAGLAPGFSPLPLAATYFLSFLSRAAGRSTGTPWLPTT